MILAGVADDYSPVPGKYKAMRWDGSNTEAFKTWVQGFITSHTFAANEWSVVSGAGPNGETLLTVQWSPNGVSWMSVSVYMGWWAVFGPYWGTDPTNYWEWSQLADADFQRQFNAAA